MKDLKSMFDQAVRLHQAGDLAAAETLYRELARLAPEQPDIPHLLGLAALDRGAPREAATWIERAIALKATEPYYHVSRGRAHRALGEGAAAETCFARAIALDPRLAEAHSQWGMALKARGAFDRAIPALKEAVRLQSLNPDHHLNLGAAWLEVRHHDQAEACFREATRLQPERKEAHNILGFALQSQGKLEEAKASYRRAVALDPKYADAHNNLAGTLKAQGSIREAIASYRTALNLRSSPEMHGNLLLALNFTQEPPETIFAEHRHFDQLYLTPLIASWPTHHNERTGDRRLRIGYVSADFINHSVAYFFEPVMERHDRRQFEVFCYSHVTVPDATTERLRGHADVWRDISSLNDQQVADQVRADRIDILVDLAGHMAKNRLMVFARKPAPVQATWIGYPNTTGMTAMDYRLTDAIADPPGQTERWHSEQLIRLPRNFSCYRPADDSPEVSALPAAQHGGVTFGCFNNFAKITDEALSLWTRIVNAVPRSRLLLKAKSLRDPGTLQGLFDRLARAGLSRDRVVCDSAELSTARHLDMYRQVDLALDTFPYNGTTTTCEALWMGVPVITLTGSTHVARVGTSLLAHLGAPEWIASSPDEYVARAVSLANDLGALAGLRSGLRPRMRGSPLCDASTFTRDLETVYRRMWQQWTE